MSRDWWRARTGGFQGCRRCPAPAMPSRADSQPIRRILMFLPMCGRSVTRRSLRDTDCLVAAVAGQYRNDDFVVRRDVGVLAIGDDVIEPYFEAMRARRDFQYLCAVARLGGMTSLHAIDEQERVHRQIGRASGRERA